MATLDLVTAWAINQAHIWPAGLPDKPLQDGYSERLPSVLIRTNMDKGPAKVRRRFTANVRPITCKLILTRAQLSTFEYFYHVDCADGSLRFNWNNPITEVAYEFRFVGEPTIEPVNGADWMVTFNLEQMP